MITTIAGMLCSDTWPHVSFYLFIAALIPVCPAIMSDAVKEWRKGDIFNEYTLMLLACIGAFALKEYPEAVAILIFYSFGEKLEDSASDKARSRIRSLLECLPKLVEVKTDKGIEMQKPEDVAVGSTIIVKAGERVAIDSVLVSPEKAVIDNSAITGESMPVTVNAGDEILSGAIVSDREIQATVRREYKDSSMSRIMDMIETAAARKSHSETLLRKITRYYTPAVIIAAVLLFTIPWAEAMLSSHYFEWKVWLERTLILLVCSCPCALVISIPLSYFAAIGSSSKFGVLFKGSSYIDALRTSDILILDKTGTITTGKLHVIKIIPAAGHVRDEVIDIAGMIEQHSTHPLAKAICSYVSEKMPGLTLSDIVTEDHGIKSMTNRGLLTVGNREYLKKYGVDMTGIQYPDDTEVCVAIDGDLYGTILLADTLKPDIGKTIGQLRALGIKAIGILSGDNERVVSRISKICGVDFHKSNMLPADKQNYISNKIRDGRRIIFVGDGINDAPSLATASVGIAIGTGGTDIAMESADAVITGHDLTHLVDAIRISRRLKTVVTFNVTFAILVKLAVMVLGAVGLATLWAAVFADTGIMVITVALSLLCLSPKTISHGKGH